MSKADELAKLDALRQSGVLTQEEFDAEKAKLLGELVVSPVSEVPQQSGSSSPQGDRSWQATDGKRYPPEPHPEYRPSPPNPESEEASAPSPLAVQTQPTFSAPTTGVADEKQYNNKTFLVVLGILVLIGAAIGIVFLVNGLSRSSQNTAAKSNLQNALTGAETYFTDSNQSYAGLTTPSPNTSDIQQIGTGLAWVPATTPSTGPGTISSRVTGGGSALVLTAYAPSSDTCYGILDVTSSQAQPIFAKLPETASVGTYYFATQQSGAGHCQANLASVGTLTSRTPSLVKSIPFPATSVQSPTQVCTSLITFNNAYDAALQLVNSAPTKKLERDASALADAAYAYGAPFAAEVTQLGADMGRSDQTRIAADLLKMAHSCTALGYAITSGGSTTGGGSNQSTSAESNLQNALTGAKTYFTDSSQSYDGLTTPSPNTSDIQQIGTGLAWVPATTPSTGPGTISSRVIGGGSALVLTAYAPSSDTCYGILDVTSSQAQPIFSGYPETAAPGTYYFVNLQPSPGDCKASVTPADALSPSGW